MSYRKAFLYVIPVVLLAVLAIGAKSDGGTSDEDEARRAAPAVKIDDLTLTVGYVESAAERQSPLLRQGIVEDAEKRKEFVDKLVNMELLAAEARRRGYSDDPEVTSVMKNQLASLMHKQLADEIKEQDPREEAMRKYYDDHSDSYNKPEKVRARHILIADEAAAQALLDEIISKKPSQYEFRKMAQEKSEDSATKLRGGDLTFFPRVEARADGDPEVPSEVVEAAFGLKENGQVSDKIVKSDKGYHIIMRTGHRKAMELSFEEAKDRLGLLVKREDRKNRTEAAIDALKDRFDVTLHEENLKEVVIDLSGGPKQAGPITGLSKKERNKLKSAVSKKKD